MYMVDGYGENDPIVVKSQFIMSLVERIDPKGRGGKAEIHHRPLYGQAVRGRGAIRHGADPATLREKLLDQPEDMAHDIALALELFTTGSLDIFGHKSTVDLDKRVVVFDIHGLGEQLKPIGHLVITDTMLNRVTLNWKKGKRTHVFIDEFHVMFENEFSAAFFQLRVAALPQAQRLPDGHHAERRVPARLRAGLDDALELRVHRHAQPGGKRPGEAGAAFEYLHGADGLHHERRCRVRAYQIRLRPGAIREPFSQKIRNCTA